MLYAHLGNTTFLRGITLYLKKHKYQNAVTNDLWDSLVKGSSRPSIKLMMNTWTKQAGYPVVTVSQNGSRTSISQKRFFHVQPNNVSEIPASEYG